MARSDSEHKKQKLSFINVYGIAGLDSYFSKWLKKLHPTVQSIKAEVVV
jgi:hypothetical protein